MNEKVKNLLQKLPSPKTVAKVLGSLGFFVALVLAAALYAFPAEKYRPLVLKQVKAALQAQDVSVQKLSWAFSPRDFSFGLQLRGLEVKGGPRVESASIPSLIVKTQPFKILFGKIPARISMTEARIHAASLPAKGAPQKAEAKPSAPPMPGAGLPKWVEYVRVNLDLGFEELQLPSSEGQHLLLKQGKLGGTVAGFPGHFDLLWSSDVDLESTQPLMSAKGPVHAKASGFFQTTDGKIVGLKIAEFAVDTEEVTATALGWFEKPQGVPFSVSSGFQFVLSENLQVKGIEVEGGRVEYDGVRFELSGRYEEGKLQTKWAIGRTEIDGFRLPVKGLRNIPLGGILETSGSLSLTPGGLDRGEWRLALNNVKFNTSNIPTDEGVAKGELDLSFMSEGSIEGGRIFSPRTELQIDGSNAELVFWGGRTKKPIGIPFLVVVKSHIEKDHFQIDELKAVFHTFELIGTGQVDDIVSAATGGTSNFQLQLDTNRLDVSKYAVFLQMFRKPPPLEGFFEFSGGLNGRIDKSAVKFDELDWRLDRLHLSNFRVLIDRESFVQFGITDSNYGMNGPLMASLLFKGRGEGLRLDRGLLMANVDLTDAAIFFENSMRKPAKVPLYLDVFADQSRRSLKVRRGELKVFDSALRFDGLITQGYNNGFLNVRTVQPLNLSRLQAVLPGATALQGLVDVQTKVGFPKSSSLEASFDWKGLTLEGEVSVQKVQGKFPQLTQPVRDGAFKVLFANDAVTVSSLKGQVGGAEVFASGKIGFQKSNVGNLRNLLSGENWDVSGALSLSRYDAKDWAAPEVEAPPPTEKKKKASFPVAEPTAGEKLKALLDDPKWKKNKWNVGLRVGTGSWEKWDFSNLNLHFVSEDGGWRAQPFSVDALGGQVSGSFVLNAEPYRRRKDPPELGLSLKVSSVDMTDAVQHFKPEMAALLGGKFSGRVTLTSQGFEVEDWMRTARGRMSGTVEQGRFDSLPFVQKVVDDLFARPEARDYLMREARKEACVQKEFTADLDAQIAGGGAEVEHSKFRFKTGSTIEMKGRLTKDLAVDFDGNFWAGPQCIGGDVRACLADNTGLAVIPFHLAGPASAPTAKADVSKLAQKVASCVVNRVAKKAQDAILQTPAANDVKSELKKAESRAKDALQGLFNKAKGSE